MTSKQITPIFALLATSVFWGVLWYPIRLLEGQGLTGPWVIFLIYLIALVVGGCLLLKTKPPLGNNYQLLLLLAITSGWCNASFIIAVVDGNIVRVMLLFYLAPLWAVLLGRFMLGEKITKASSLIILLALTGALIMLWDGKSDLPLPRDFTDWLAISSGFTFALSNVYARKGKDIDLWLRSGFVWGGVAVLTIVFIIYEGVALPELSVNVMLGLVVLACFGVVCMTLLLQYGVANMPVHRSATILLFELVAGAISAQLLTDELVSPQEWVGGALIILAALKSTHSQIIQSD